MTSAFTSADASRQDVVRALTRRFTSWCLWYGRATGRWWRFHRSGAANDSA